MTGIYIPVNDPDTFKKAVIGAFLSPWSFCFPGGLLPCYRYEPMKKSFHGNAKMLLHLFKNEITGKYDMQCTTRAIERTYPQNRGRLNIVDVDNVDYDYLCSVFGEIA